MNDKRRKYACMYDLAPPRGTRKRNVNWSHKSISYVFAKSYAVIIKHNKQTELGLNVTECTLLVHTSGNTKHERQKTNTRNTKAQTQNIEDKIQKTKGKSLIHKIQNIP